MPNDPRRWGRLALPRMVQAIRSGLPGIQDRRALPLPRRVARLDLVRASLRDGLLEVAFATSGGARCG